MHEDVRTRAGGLDPNKHTRRSEEIRCKMDSKRNHTKGIRAVGNTRIRKKPERVEDGREAPEDHNCYCDGSLKHPVGNHWAIRGLGVWWPDRKEVCEPLNSKEERYMDHEWKYGGYADAKHLGHDNPSHGSKPRC